MAFPTFIDEVAFASNPFDSPQVYTAVTARTRLRSWSRGRQTENEQSDTGRSRLELENLDRALDPENAASAYSPNVLPMRRTRSRATFDAVTFYPLFTTFVDPTNGWQLELDQTGKSFAIAQANDGFDVLSTAEFTALDSFPTQTVAARINAILDLFSWPAAERAIDTSDTAPIQSAPVGSLTGQSALDQINAAVATENGIFFINGSGYAVFHDRYHKILNTRSAVSQATFCDHDNYAPGRFLYKSCPPSTSAIINDYLVTRNGGGQVEALDSASIDKYRRRSKTLNTLHITDAEAVDFGKYKVVTTREPSRRYDELVLEPGDDIALWTALLNLEISDMITVMQSPPGGGAADVRDLHVEAINFVVGPGVTATVTLRLSPGTQTTGWILGDAVHSLLGTTTVLVY